MNVLVVFDHPRRKSLSGAVLDQFVDGLKEAGHVPEIADLHAENFDPRMPVEDEPDLCGANNTYTEAVMALRALYMVCVQHRSLDDVLRSHCWSAQTFNRDRLRLSVLAALGDVACGLGYMARDDP